MAVIFVEKKVELLRVISLPIVHICISHKLLKEDDMDADAQAEGKVEAAVAMVAMVASNSSL
eukprot:15334703-Ditylum_brightwellii.AAC.2